MGIKSLDGITADMQTDLEKKLKPKKGGKKPYPTRRKKKRKRKTKKKARGGSNDGYEIGYDEINLFLLIILALINLAMVPQLFQEPRWERDDE